MTCPEIRERLPEYALGVLPPDDAASVERHLEWCSGCRKEAGEMQEALAGVGFSLPQADPPSGLEDRIVELVTGVRGRHRPPQRRGMRILAATTLAAVLAAVSAVGWGFAERRRADDIEKRRIEQVQTIEQLRVLVDELGGREAQLDPTSGNIGTGVAIVIPAEGANDRVFVQIVLPDYDSGPYTVRLLNRSGKTRLSGQLVLNNNDELVLFQETSRDLREAVSVSVLDGSGLKILRGDIRPYPSPAPPA